MLRAHKIRLDPTKEQQDYFARACGTARFAYNWGLSEWMRQRAEGGKPNEAGLRRQLNGIKREQFPWMLEVTKCAVQQALKNLGTAYGNAFGRIKKGKRSGCSFGFPAFKRKGRRDSFRADNGPMDDESSAVETAGKTVKLPRCGVVRMREELRFPGRILSATVSRQSDGWYVSLLVETADKLERKIDRGAVGVDLGVKSLATFSDGTVIESRKPHRALGVSLVRYCRSLSRKVKGSMNRGKAKTKLARLHLRIANIRKDVLHKLTHKLATEYSIIAIEDLNVAGMMKNHHLARSVADCGFGEFRRQLQYKSEMTGASVFVVDRFFPSSKTCSACGVVKPMPLSERTFRCECGITIDRDLNAAKNILRQALPLKSVESRALVADRFATKPDSLKQKTERSSGLARPRPPLGERCFVFRT